MFTGLVEEVGSIVSVRRAATSARIEVRARVAMESTSVGDSISVSGVCLTVVAMGPDTLFFDAVPETLNRSSLKGLAAGDRVNLERSLAAGQRMGGHFVQGHVDGVARIGSIREAENARVVRVAPPGDLMRFIAPKGSVALDGISLTVADIQPDSFEVWIIPHTWTQTTLGSRKAGDALNIETDMLARYLDRLLSARSEPIDEHRLRAAGFE